VPVRSGVVARPERARACPVSFVKPKFVDGVRQKGSLSASTSRIGTLKWPTNRWAAVRRDDRDRPQPSRRLRPHDRRSVGAFLPRRRADPLSARPRADLFLFPLCALRRRFLRRSDDVPRIHRLHRGGDGWVPRRLRLPVLVHPARMAVLARRMDRPDYVRVRRGLRSWRPRDGKARSPTDRANGGARAEDATVPEMRGEGRRRGPQVLVLSLVPPADVDLRMPLGAAQIFFIRPRIGS
jgi:hypothetical protein